MNFTFCSLNHNTNMYVWFMVCDLKLSFSGSFFCFWIAKHTSVRWVLISFFKVFQSNNQHLCLTPPLTVCLQTTICSGMLQRAWGVEHDNDHLQRSALLCWTVLYCTAQWTRFIAYYHLTPIKYYYYYRNYCVLCDFLKKRCSTSP